MVHTTLPSCATWPSTSCVRTKTRSHYMESSNSPPGKTNTLPNSSRKFEMRLPCGASWSTLKVSNPDWVQNKRLNVMLQAGAKPQAGLPDVPLVIDLASTPEDRILIELLFFPQEMG